jgi:hypothetical protein
MNWLLGANKGQHPIFGTLDPISSAFYNDPSGYGNAWQKLTDYFTGGNSYGIMGQWLANQQQPFTQRFENQQFANAQQGRPAPLMEDFINQNAGSMLGKFALLPAYYRGASPGMLRSGRITY